MTARVRVAGILSHAPEGRILKAGQPVATATLKAKDGDHTRFGHVVGQIELSFGVIPEEVLPLCQPGKKQKTEATIVPSKRVPL
jgi:hypothetical protein